MADQSAHARIVRRVKRGQTRYVGSADDLIAAGIIGSHMIPAPTEEKILDFHYGKRVDWDWGCGLGVQQVFWSQGRLAVYCWGEDDDQGPIRPSWNIRRDGNVIHLPTAAAAKVIQTPRRGRLPRGIANIRTMRERRSREADTASEIRGYLDAKRETLGTLAWIDKKIRELKPST